MRTNEDIFQLLSEIPDPEIPVISITDLGVIRAIDIANSENITVNITPTYSGCPAMKQIEDDVKKKLLEHGFKNITVNTVFSPPWTTDWIPEEAKERLRKYGIARQKKAHKIKVG